MGMLLKYLRFFHRFWILTLDERKFIESRKDFKILTFILFIIIFIHESCYFQSFTNLEHRSNENFCSETFIYFRMMEIVWEEFCWDCRCFSTKSALNRKVTWTLNKTVSINNDENIEPKLENLTKLNENLL